MAADAEYAITTMLVAASRELMEWAPNTLKVGAARRILVYAVKLQS
jgi:hypothetical protein